MPSWRSEDAIEPGGRPDDFDGRITADTHFEVRGDFLELYILIEAPTIREHRVFSDEYPDGLTGERLMVGKAADWEILDGGTRIKHRTITQYKFFRGHQLLWLSDAIRDSGAEDIIPNAEPDDTTSCEWLFDREFHWKRINPPDYASQMEKLRAKGTDTRTYVSKTTGETITVLKDLSKLMPVAVVGNGTNGEESAQTDGVNIPGIIERVVSTMLEREKKAVAKSAVYGKIMNDLRKEPDLAPYLPTIASIYFAPPFAWLSDEARPWASKGATIDGVPF